MFRNNGLGGSTLLEPGVFPAATAAMRGKMSELLGRDEERAPGFWPYLAAISLKHDPIESGW